MRTTFAALVLSVVLSSAGAPFATADGGAEPQSGLHIGVRTVAVGDPIPVTVVGAEPGTTWEVRELDSGTVLGVLSIGEDGSGTTTVSLPLSTDVGAARIVAVHDGTELGAEASVGSREGVPAGAPVAAAVTDPAPSGPPLALLIVPAAVAAVGAGGVIALRRRAPRGRRNQENLS